MIRGEHGIQRMPCSSQIISEMLPEIHTIELCDFSQIYNALSNSLILCFIFSLHFADNQFLKTIAAALVDFSELPCHAAIHYLLEVYV